MVERFMRKVRVSDDGCWTWTARKDRFGYGRFGIGATGSKLAHRVAYELFTAAIPEGSQVIHSCDNPSCVNPAHLLIGSAAQNASDKAKKWRGNRSRKGLPFGATPHGNRWESMCRVGGKQHYLGMYATADEASAVASAFKMRSQP